ncbi:MAG: hypothetical protein R3A52_04270 [Polyangiales bacterium]
MKTSRSDQRRVTMRYRHDRATGRSTLVIDVESPEDEMPHEHRQDLKEMAEELLGVPLGSLPEGVEVNLKRVSPPGHTHGEGEHEHEHEETAAQQRGAIKQS